FTEQDIKGAQETVIVNEALAARFWPNEYPIGKRLQRGKSGPWRTVVGIIRDAKDYSAEKEPPIAVYYPADQVIARSMYLVIRTTSDPVPMTAALIKKIQAVDPEMPVYDVSSMDQRLYGSLARQRFSMFGIGARDLFTFVVTPLLLGTIAWMASYIPARRAAKVDPMIALRHE